MSAAAVSTLTSVEVATLQKLFGSGARAAAMAMSNTTAATMTGNASGGAALSKSTGQASATVVAMSSQAAMAAPRKFTTGAAGLSMTPAEQEVQRFMRMFGMRNKRVDPLLAAAFAS